MSMQFLTVKDFIRTSLLVIFITPVAGHATAAPLSNEDIFKKEASLFLEVIQSDFNKVMSFDDFSTLISNKVDLLLVLASAISSHEQEDWYQIAYSMLAEIKKKLEEVYGSKFDREVKLLANKCDHLIEIIETKIDNQANDYKQDTTQKVDGVVAQKDNADKNYITDSEIAGRVSFFIESIGRLPIGSKAFKDNCSLIFRQIDSLKILLINREHFMSVENLGTLYWKLKETIEKLEEVYYRNKDEKLKKARHAGRSFDHYSSAYAEVLGHDLGELIKLIEREINTPQKKRDCSNLLLATKST